MAQSRRMAKPYKMYAAKGGGSMIVEAAFGFTKLALTIKDVDWDDLGWGSKTLKGLNPLGQVPTFTYGDVPQRWVGAPKDKGAGKALRQSTDEHRQMLLRFLELQVKGPWFLGRTMSALDVYVWVLATWRPGTDWLKAECPKLFRIAEAMGQHEVCKRVAERNAS